MTAVLLVPTVLSLLLAGAHFLRADQDGLVVLSVALIALVAVPRRWAAYLLQGALLLIAAEWVRTTVALVSVRQAHGLPSGRMAAILGGVALVAVLAALLLRTRRLQRRFR